MGSSMWALACGLWHVALASGRGMAEYHTLRDDDLHIHQGGLY